MRLIFLIILILLIHELSFTQTEYVPVDNSVYEFLERMETLQIIPEYNSFEIPKTRREISGYIKTIIKSQQLLDGNDQKYLNDLKVEFEYELYNSLNNSASLISKGKYDFFSQQQKYLYYYNDPDKINLFVNLIGEGQLLSRNNQEANSSSSAFLGIIGGDIRGTILNKFGFYINGTNGNVFGKRDAALLRRDLQYNYKLNENPEETFFDETLGYLTADFDLIKFKFGRDRKNIGYGMNKIILANSSPLFDYFALNIHYNFFDYSFFHGQLLGQETFTEDSISGGVHVVASKYMAYHRIGFNISKDISFGAGEVIIYGDRPVDLSYLNPFSFYKSIEHSNRDRDNALLFFDANNKSIEGLKINASLLIDDITFSKLGTGWWGNQTILDAGIHSELLYGILPLSIDFQYTKIDPYVYTHRLLRNNYTNFGYNLSSFTNPNSELFLTGINFRFNNRLELSIVFNYKIHGANPLNTDGSLKENIGGNVAIGHRVFDPEHVNFLDGELEFSRQYKLRMIYEPYNEYFLSTEISYLNESLQNIRNENLNLIFTLSIKI
ncbi:MAG TPA: hypothetical protein VLB50_13415 [Ignavibacteriaceae bacterium]|nr:hypothetical protein [Ignavibacteriaceae bacterium]